MATTQSLRRSIVCLTGIALIAVLLPQNAAAQEHPVFLGVKIKAGARYDNVRMCVASKAGAKGGPAADVTFYTEVGLTDDMSISVDLPVFRPIMFAAAFGILQFEPDVSLLFRVTNGDSADLIVGPTIGLSLHSGPDYNSDRAKGKRSPSFFAMGPRIGAYLAADFKKDRKDQLPYSSGINAPVEWILIRPPRGCSISMTHSTG